MSINKSANAVWKGSLKEGTGHISSQSTAFDNQPYGFNTRFEEKAGTNPEELIAAAHASCFTMALSKQLADNGIEPQKLETKCTVSLDQNDEGFAITKSHLEFTASLNGADEVAFRKALGEAKEGCPISKVLDTEITLDINLSE